jgi:hypothetical protein
MPKPLLNLFIAAVLLLGLAACSPEVGSEKWCQQMENKAKGDWTANQAADYTQHCIFRTDES